MPDPNDPEVRDYRNRLLRRDAEQRGIDPIEAGHPDWVGHAFDSDLEPEPQPGS